MSEEAALSAQAAATGRPRWRRRLALPLAVLVLGLLLWVAGFLWFTHLIPATVADPATPTDAVVVLTGGRDRVESGFDLLVEGKARMLFISGVHRGIALEELLRLLPQVPRWVACCTELGYAAGNTAGNARETAAWMQQHGYHSLRLVTGSYHLPRSLVEFRHEMPDVTIVPHPVFPPNVKKAWWAWPGTAALILTEYHKYLVAVLLTLLPWAAPA
jgi:uncharacterized SAM-binding protein YcdF (DUF218 family)